MRRREFIGLICASAARLPSVRAQQSSSDHIAWIHPSAPTALMRENGPDKTYSAFLEELHRLGHVEGVNLVLDRYSANGRADQYDELAQTVARSKPALIFTSGTDMAKHLVAATRTIPIVGVLTDPAATGLITNLAHPGGNITGASVDAGIEIWSKRLALLKEMVPAASRIGFLASRIHWEATGRSGEATRAAAAKLGLSPIGCVMEESAQEPDYRRVFAAMAPQHLDALVISDQAEHRPNQKLIIELVQQSGLPAIYPYPDYVALGGLIAYAVDLTDAFRVAARQVDQILKGAHPADIPFYQQTRFRLMINLKTARMLGLQVPSALLASADDVIE
jgi:ABC-type uncharacterized transport system substrate-binding protein